MIIYPRFVKIFLSFFRKDRYEFTREFRTMVFLLPSPSFRRKERRTRIESGRGVTGEGWRGKGRL